MIDTIMGYTDYPFASLGDDYGKKKYALRRVAVVAYDGNKYCQVIVADRNGVLVSEEIKIGYVHKDADLTSPVTHAEAMNRLRNGGR